MFSEISHLQYQINLPRDDMCIYILQNYKLSNLHVFYIEIKQKQVEKIIYDISRRQTKYDNVKRMLDETRLYKKNLWSSQKKSKKRLIKISMEESFFCFDTPFLLLLSNIYVKYVLI